MKMATNRPTRKVTTGALAGAIASMVMLIVNQYVVPERPLPAEAGAALATILTFLASYISPPSGNDIIMPD